MIDFPYYHLTENNTICELLLILYSLILSSHYKCYFQNKRKKLFKFKETSIHNFLNYIYLSLINISE